MREIEGITFLQAGLQYGPYSTLGCIGNQVLDHCGLFSSFLDGKKGLPREQNRL